MERKKEQARVDNFKKTAALRKYAKLCKAEGIESQRVNMGERMKSSDNIDESGETKKIKKEKKKSPSINPFHKEEKIANERKLNVAKKDALLTEKQKEIEQKKKERDEKRKIFKQKTSKGQPLMKNRITSLLSKIQDGM